MPQRASEVLEQPVWGEPCPASEDSTSTEPAKQPGKGARSPAAVADDGASSGSIRPDSCDRVVHEENGSVPSPSLMLTCATVPPESAFPSAGCHPSHNVSFVHFKGSSLGMK